MNVDIEYPSIKIQNVIHWANDMIMNSKSYHEIARIELSPFPKCHITFIMKSEYRDLNNRKITTTPVVDCYQSCSDGMLFPTQNGLVHVPLEQLRSFTGPTPVASPDALDDPHINDVREVRWTVQREFLLDGKLIGGVIIYVGKDGAALSSRNVIKIEQNFYEYVYEIISDRDEAEDALEHFRNTLIDANVYIGFATSLMHCKNVELTDEPLSRQRRRKLERKGGIQYKVLDIEPFKKQVRREAEPGEPEGHRAMHICRGHFATYTKEKPLFGRVEGTFWKPMHVRGTRDQGLIIKDYNINTDK